jgi:hypothetical protein
VEVLARMFELPSLEEGVRTVAEQAQTRSTTTNDVSTGQGRTMRSSTAPAAGGSDASSGGRRPVEWRRSPQSHSSDGGCCMRQPAEAAKVLSQPAKRGALSPACEAEEWAAEAAPEDRSTRQGMIGHAFRHRIRAHAGRFGPSAGNTAAWAASAADHEIVPFSAISAPIGLKMRASAPHVRANAHTYTEERLRDLHVGSGGQRTSSSR